MPDTITNCYCCGMPYVGQPPECDGCMDSHVDSSETWHRDQRGGHSCDGTMCTEYPATEGG